MTPLTATMMSTRDATPPAGDEQVLADARIEEFAALVKEHQHRLCNFLQRYTRNRQDAEDLTQDTFHKALRNFHRYDGRASFAAWLYTIARNTAYNHHRDRKATQALDFEVPSSTASPDTTAEDADERNSLWAQVEQLPSPYDEVLILRYRESLSVQDVARVMKRTETGVKVLLFRARAQLRKLQTQPPIR